MKITLDFNDQLLADAKALAARQRTSLTRLIEEGLQLQLRANATSATQGGVRLPVFKGRGGLVAGVDPLSNKALLDAVGDDAPNSRPHGVTCGCTRGVFGSRARPREPRC